MSIGKGLVIDSGMTINTNLKSKSNELVEEIAYETVWLSKDRKKSLIESIKTKMNRVKDERKESAAIN